MWNTVLTETESFRHLLYEIKRQSKVIFVHFANYQQMFDIVNRLWLLCYFTFNDIIAVFPNNDGTRGYIYIVSEDNIHIMTIQ